MINNSAHESISIASIAAPKLPLYSIENNGEIIYVFYAPIIRLLSEVFRLPYKIFLPSDGEFGTKLPDGNWTGLIGMVHRSEVDLADCSEITYPRFQEVNFTYPHLFSDITFMTDKLKSYPTSLAIIHPFPLLFWILLIATTFLFSCLIFLLLNRKETCQNVIFMVFGSLLEESIGMHLRKCSLKLIIGAWLIFVFLIINSYKAVLLSILTLPRLTGIRSIPDLAKAAEQNSVTCYAYKGTALQQNLLESEFATWRSIGKCLERNVLNSENAEKAFFKAPSNKAFIAARSFLIPYEEMYFISEDSFYISMIAFTVSKKFRHQSYLNEKVHQLFAAGVFQKIDNDVHFILKLNAISSDSNEPGKLKILQREDLKGAFMVLFFGYVLSTIVLFIEIAVNRYLHKSNFSLFKRRRKILKKTYIKD